MNCAIIYAFLLYFVSTSQSTNVYTLAEQQTTHYDAALDAYKLYDVKKSIRIFEYLTHNLGSKHPAYPYTVCNLGILYTKLGDSTNGIRYGNIALKFDATNLMAVFVLGYNLYTQKQLYDAFMVFRGIKNVKTRMKDQYDPVVSYNLGICLYKLGGKGGDIHFQNALDKIGLQSPDPVHTSRFQKYTMARSAAGVEYTIDMGPLEGFNIFSMKGHINDKATQEIQQNYYNNQRSISSPRIGISPSSPDDILQYYFTPSEETHPTSAPLPPPHKIGKHIDHFEDYFSHRPNRARCSPLSPTPSSQRDKQLKNNRLDIIPKPLAVAKRPGMPRFYTTS